MWVVAMDYHVHMKSENITSVLDIVLLIPKVSTGQLRLLMSQAARLREEFPESMSIGSIIQDYLVLDTGSPLLSAPRYAWLDRIMIMPMFCNLIGWIQLGFALPVVNMLNEKFPRYLRIKGFT
jgi:hypothetical protein